MGMMLVTGAISQLDSAECQEHWNCTDVVAARGVFVIVWRWARRGKRLRIFGFTGFVLFYPHKNAHTLGR